MTLVADNIEQKPLNPAKQKQFLTPKQLKFIQHYIDTQNATKAVELAGYSKKRPDRYAQLLLKSPLVKQALQRYRDELNMRVIVTFNDKVNLLWEIAQRCSRPRVEQVGDKCTMVDRTPTAIKAVEVLNSMQGHVAPAQQVNINVQSTIEKLKQCAIEYKDY